MPIQHQLSVRCYQILLGFGKHINIIMKPTNSSTQGQPKPEKKVKKWHLGHFFPHRAISLRGLELILYGKQTTTNLTQPSSPINTVLDYAYSAYGLSASSSFQKMVDGPHQNPLYIYFREISPAVRVILRSIGLGLKSQVHFNILSELGHVLNSPRTEGLTYSLGMLC